jgi:hypothetical protein
MTDDLQVDLAEKRTFYITLSNNTASVLYQNLHSIYCSQGTSCKMKQIQDRVKPDPVMNFIDV